MKKILSLTVITLAFAAVGFGQTTGNDKKAAKTDEHDMSRISERKPIEYDNESDFDKNGVMTRGAGVFVGKDENVKTVALADVLKKPADFAGKTVVVEGVIVRSCKAEGCWMELAPAKDTKSVRVKFKDHAFFIPLDAAGLNAKAKGVFSVKTLSKAEVDHLVNDDGAKFDSINADGTVTEIAFEATGVELTKPTK